jgi:hypothetical protein
MITEMERKEIHSNLHSALEKAEDTYLREVRAIADTLMDTVVKPYCDLRNTRFVSGMGAYVFIDKHGNHKEEIGNRKAGPELREVLDLIEEVDFKGTAIHCYMGDYIPMSASLTVTRGELSTFRVSSGNEKRITKVI